MRKDKRRRRRGKGKNYPEPHRSPKKEKGEEGSPSFPHTRRVKRGTLLA